MEGMFRRSFLIVCLLCLVSASARPLLVFAQEAQTVTTQDTTDDSLKTQIDTIQAQVKEKQKTVQALDKTIQRYQDQAKQQATMALTLKNQLDQLENAIATQQAKIQRSQELLALLALQITETAQHVTHDEAVLRVRQALLEEALTAVDRADQTSGFLSFFEQSSFSSYIAEQEDVQTLQRAVLQAMNETKAAKQAHEQAQKELEDKHAAADVERLSFQAEKDRLEEQKQAKESLIVQTQNKESEFQRVVGELRVQQQSEAEAQRALEERLKEKLDSSDETLARGDILLQWPIHPQKGISAQFHDQSYPFRALFEHPGIDLPTPVGTPVHAAAGGYVAWNRTGKQYGNYVMIVHPGGIATVYAHLSQFGAQPDTYVERGQVIGYSGGRPGDQGAGLSTGAHLHFEVRQNGIPVNPENFLPEL
jgi:murein DD-endopeptidase MepM/ murein hydrolase activator NlpD